jgi:hypothetical protein
MQTMSGNKNFMRLPDAQVPFQISLINSGKKIELADFELTTENL